MKTLTINMKANDTAEVLLYAVIGESFWEDGISAKTFREQIKAIKASVLNLRINSPGGSVFEASAMMAALDEFKGTVEIDVDGLAASAASVVAMAGDVVRVASNGLLMIHNPMSGVLGGADDMRREADLLDKVKGQIIDAYRRKSKAEREAIAKWMDEETWFTGQEAVDAGLADEVTAPVQVAAMARFAGVMDKFHFRHPPSLENAAALAMEETRKRRERLAALTPVEVKAEVPVAEESSEPDPPEADPQTQPRRVRRERTFVRDENGLIVKEVTEQVPAKRRKR